MELYKPFPHYPDWAAITRLGSSDPTAHPPVATWLAGWMDAMDGEKQTSTVVHIEICLQIFVLEIYHVTIRILKLQIFISLHSISM